MRQLPAGRETGRLAGWLTGALDAFVVLLATWTVVYHACLLLTIGSTIALMVEALLLVALVVWVARGRGLSGSLSGDGGFEARRWRSSHLDHRPARSARAITVTAATVAGLAMALDLAWPVVWVAWLVAALSGTWWAAGSYSAAGAAGGPAASVRDGSGAGFALACAGVLAGLATVTLRPNPDDLFYLNLSQWVASTGDFPVRDTIYADLRYPMSNWPPLASYDALTGALAHLAGIRAGEVVYVVVPPVATALAVLALWRLLRAWRVRHVVVALAAALLFLMFDGTVSYGTPGNLFLTRLWQGKVILLCVVVPTLLTYALAYVDRPSRRGAGRLLLGGAAAVGCSTTAIFLVPVIALGSVAPLVLRRAPRAALTGFVALTAYSLAAGVVTLALGGRSADDFGERRLYRFDPAWFGHEVFLTGVVAFVAVLAVLLGTLLVPHPAARLTTGVLTASAGVVLIPGVTQVIYDAVGLGPTLWRLTWALTVAGLVGVLAAALWSWAPSTRVAWLGAAVAAVVLGVTGPPIWASDTNTSLHWPPHWQRGDDARATAAWAIEQAGPGGLVLGPDGLAITVAVTTTEVKTVAPRDYYLDYLRDEPGFRYDDRLLLVDFANALPGRREDVGAPLRALGVDVACVYRDDLRGLALLDASGYRMRPSSTTYACGTLPDIGTLPNAG